MSHTFVNACGPWRQNVHGGAIGGCMYCSQRELGVINHKRVYRLYRLEETQAPPEKTQAGSDPAA